MPLDLQENLHLVSDLQAMRYLLIFQRLRLTLKNIKRTIDSEHLSKTYGVNKDVKFAIAGRSAEKLEKVKKEVAELIGDTR